MQHLKQNLTALACTTVLLSHLIAAAATTNTNARIQWWREAKFGLFIHWGLYAIPGRGEWVQWNEQIPINEYARLADQFNPTNFSADAWAQLARDAGAKYVVLTARHHDGFALFNDGTNTFTSVKSAAQRDFVAEYVAAVNHAGLRVGLYYSPLDWRFPGYIMPDLQRESAEAMRAQYHRQVRELLANYGKIDVLWFDGGEADWLSFGGDWSGAEWKKRAKDKPYPGGFDWQHEQVYKTLRTLQPDILINGRADMVPDFYSREGYGALGDFDNQQPWELCVPMAGAWGYQPNRQPLPLKDYIQLLVKVAGRDGNLLMNVGPDRNGRIDDLQVARLREIGNWLGQYGESIFGTRGGPFLPAEWGVSTHRRHTVYLHVLKWPADRLVLPALPAKIVSARTWRGDDLNFTQNDHEVGLALPTALRDDLDTIVVLNLDTPADTLPPVK